MRWISVSSLESDAQLRCSIYLMRDRQIPLFFLGIQFRNRETDQRPDFGLLRLDLDDVEAPVHEVEEEEGDGEDDPGVLVDDVHVLDPRDHALHRVRPLLDVGEDLALPLPLPALPAGRVVPAAHPEGRRELLAGGLVLPQRRGGGEAVADARDRAEPDVVELDDLVLAHGSAARSTRARSGGCGGSLRGVFALRFLLLLLLLLLLLGACAPVGVVDGGVLEQGGEDEDEAHDEVDVDGLDVGDAGEGGADAGTDRGHGQHRGDAWSDREIVVKLRFVFEFLFS